MKALLFPDPNGQTWCKEFFPGKSLLTMPLAGKTYGEHLMDLMSLTKISSVTILDCDYDPIYAEILGSGERWSRELFYHGSPPSKNMNSLLERHRKFLDDEEFLILYGPVLPLADSSEKLPKSFKEVEFDQLPDSGIFRYRKGVWEVNTVPEYKIDSLKCFYELNFMLLNNPGVYVLPGYSGEAGQYFGMNTSISHSAKLEAPVLVGDYSRVEANCHLSEGVILGKNVTIGDGTELKHSLILNHVIIGPHMEFTGKIVRGNNVIDPETGASIGVDEELALNLPQINYRAQRNFEDWIISLVLVLLYLPGYLLIPGRSLRKRLALDCYGGYWLVLRGRHGLFYTPESLIPGVFPACEGLSGKNNGFLSEMEGKYYLFYHSLSLTIKMTIAVLKRRLRG